MRLVYLFLGSIVFPLLHLRALCLAALGRLDAGALASKWGGGPVVPLHGVWVHAVSVGEVKLATLFLRQYHARYPHIALGLTVTTSTGYQQARAIHDLPLTLTYLPYDLPGPVARFINRTQPRLFVIIETELWPELYRALRRHAIPVALINAKISARSANRFMRFKGLLRPVLAAQPLVFAQSDTDATRFVELGLNAAHVRVVGQLKRALISQPGSAEQPHPSGESADSVAQTLAVLAERPVWIAGSTREGEESMCLEAQRAVLQRYPEAILILAPRHPHRFESVWREIVASGLSAQRRSVGIHQPWPKVILLDSLGELNPLYRLAHMSVLGGSLKPYGGHNPLEAIAADSLVVVGPFVESVKSLLTPLLTEGLVEQVSNADQLAQALAVGFADLPATRARAVRAHALIKAQGDPLVAVIEQLPAV